MSTRRALRRLATRCTTRLHKLMLALAVALAFFPMQAVAGHGGNHGMCALPSGATVLPMGFTIMRGFLFFVGLIVITSSSSGGGGGGDYGTSNKRLAIAAGIGIMALGILLPDLSSFLLETFGSTPTDMGLSCVFGN